MNSATIEQGIHLGLKNGFKQELLLLSSYDNFIEVVREYLLTVNVAQSLLQLNSDHSDQIRIEYPLKHFRENAFPRSVEIHHNFFDVDVVHREVDQLTTATHHQKIDIAIVEAVSSFEERIISGIELRGINQSDTLIINDAKRLALAMGAQNIVGANSFEYCFCGFILKLARQEEMVDQQLIQSRTQEAQAHWQAICDGLSFEFPSFDFNCDWNDIERIPVEHIYEIHREMDSDYSEVASKTGIVVSVVLRISRKY